MRIEFDPVKRDATLMHRGLDFANAAKVFEGRHTVELDDRLDYGENRFVTAGYLRGRFVVLVWTQRDDARRVISMRYGHEREERRWRSRLG